MPISNSLSQSLQKKVYDEAARLTGIAQRYRDVHKDDRTANSIVDQINQLWRNSGLIIQELDALSDAGADEDVLKTIGHGNILQNDVGLQAIREYSLANKKNLEHQKQLSGFRAKAEEQIFGGAGRTIEQALADPQSEIGGLGAFLKSQQSDIFRSELRPMLEMQLGAKGLLDSGANVELQSKALGGLERDRQARLMEAGLGAKEGIRGLERSDILGNIGSQQSALSNMFDLQRQGITMRFESDLARRMEDLVRELSSISNSGPSALQKVLGGIGMVGSVGAAPFTRGASLAALPSFTSMTFGPAGQEAGLGMGLLGESFFTRNRSGGGGKYQYSHYGTAY